MNQPEVPPVYSTCDGTLALLKLCGGSKPWAVQTIPVCNFVPRITERREVADVAFITLEATQTTAHGQRTWKLEVPETILQRPKALYKALNGALGAGRIVWVDQNNNLAKYLRLQLHSHAQA